MLWVAVALCLPLAASEAEPGSRLPQVEALPELSRIDDLGATTMILRGAELSARRAAQMDTVARNVYRDVARRFVGPERAIPRSTVDLCLFESTAAYRAFLTAVDGDDGASDLGVFFPGHGLVVANVGKSIGNLRHELAHALVHADFPAIPSWLTEGIGTLYGTVKDGKSGITFRVNYRLRHLRAARAAGELPDLQALAHSTAADVYGAKVAAYYALARYLLLYLDGRGELGRLYRTLRDQGATPAQQLALLRELVDFDAFLAWTDGLVIR
jgi:hypothetical protein